MYELQAILWDHVPPGMLRSFSGRAEALSEAKAAASRYRQCMIILWDLGGETAQPIYWENLERGDEYHRIPVLQFEAWLNEAEEPRQIEPIPRRLTKREREVMNNSIMNRDNNNV